MDAWRHRQGALSNQTRWETCWCGRAVRGWSRLRPSRPPLRSFLLPRPGCRVGQSTSSRENPGSSLVTIFSCSIQTPLEQRAKVLNETHQTLPRERAFFTMVRHIVRQSRDAFQSSLPSMGCKLHAHHAPTLLSYRPTQTRPDGTKTVTRMHRLCKLQPNEPLIVQSAELLSS